MPDIAGWYLLHRGWMSSPVFLQTELCERAAWVWLIEHACWQPLEIRIGGRRRMLGRGQLSYSIRYLAKAWSWHESRVRRFLNRLQTDAAIGTATDTGQLVITICNYDKYQNFENDPTQQPTQEPTGERHSSDANKNEVNTLNEVNTPSYPPDFEKFWHAYPDQRKGAKSSGFKAWKKAITKTSAEEIYAAVVRYCVSGEVQRGYAKNCAGWLNDERWTDNPLQPSTASGQSRGGCCPTNYERALIAGIGGDEA